MIQEPPDCGRLSGMSVIGERKEYVPHLAVLQLAIGIPRVDDRRVINGIVYVKSVC